MAIKDRVRFQVTKALYWKVSCWALLGLSAFLAVALWVSASFETQDAADHGRRLIIRLSDGTIEGKQASSTAPPPTQPDETTPPAETKEPEKAPEKPEAATEPAPTTEAVPAKPAGDASLPPQPAEPLPSQRTAEVPMAPLNASLQEKVAVGQLPIISATGVKPWRYYAKPYSHKGHYPMVAVVITGLGQGKAVSNDAIKLSENFSLSFSPYARDVTTWTNSARAVGHEVLMDLPLEPANFPASDPGPYGLLAGKSPDENATKLQWLMSRVQGYVGFVTPGNEAFSSHNEAFRALLESFSARGLLMVMPHEPVKKETRQTLDDSKAAYALADVMLDEEPSPAAISIRLATLEKLASKRGYAIGITQGVPLTIQELARWSADLEKRGFTLVPVSYIAGLKFPS
jgi:uncharacterized protein